MGHLLLATVQTLEVVVATLEVARVPSKAQEAVAVWTVPAGLPNDPMGLLVGTVSLRPGQA